MGKTILTNLEKATVLQKNNKFAIRSCWECNSSHDFLKNVAGLFSCNICERWFMNGGFFDDNKHCDKPFTELPPEKFIQITIVNKH